MLDLDISLGVNMILLPFNITADITLNVTANLI